MRSGGVARGGRALSSDGPVRRFFRRLRYRDQVMEHLGALLLMYPRRRQFASDFPDLRQRICEAQESGTAAPSAALQLAAGIMLELLSQLTDGERASTLAGLLGGEQTKWKALASGRLSREGDKARHSVEFAIELCGVALYIAKRMRQEGTLRGGEVQHLVSAIDAALGGEEILRKRFEIED